MVLCKYIADRISYINATDAIWHAMQTTLDMLRSR